MLLRRLLPRQVWRRWLSLVFATLRKAMSILGEAMILVAIPATCAYEARRVLLLTGEHTGGINYAAIHWCRARG